MAGPFAPVLSEPGTANVQAVQTKLPRVAEPGSSLLTDAVGAVAEGIDIFTKFKKQSDDIELNKAIDDLERVNVDKLIDGNLTASDSDPDPDDADEALPNEAQGELDRLQRLRAGVKQGVVSQDKFLIEMVSGVRKIKAMFPGHISVIDAKMIKKLGFRPSTAIIERALMGEKANEARIAGQRDAAFKAGSFSMRADGTVGPFLLENGQVDVAKTIQNGSKIIHAVAEAQTLKSANEAKAAALAFDRAEAAGDADARKAAQEVDVGMVTDISRGFDNGIDGLYGPQIEAAMQGLRRLGPEATPEQREQAMQNVANLIRQNINGLRKEYNWPFLNAKTREAAEAYIDARSEALMDPFTNKSTGFMEQAARLAAAAEGAVKYRLSQKPELFAFVNMGSFGAELVKILQVKEPKVLLRLLDDVKELGQQMSLDDVSTVTRKLMETPDSIEKLTPGEALIGLKIVRESTAKWAKNRALPMDEASGKGYFNAMHNLAKSASTLPTSKDKREAATFFSDASQVARVNELETIDPEAAQIIGTDAIYVINESIAATGRELANRPGFGDTWTVEFDNSAGSFVAKMTGELPSIAIGGEEAPILGGPGFAAGEFITTRDLRDSIIAQMDEATDIIIDMNTGLGAIEGYSHLDESLKDLDRLQVREAVAASAFLGNVEGTVSNFKTAAKKAGVQVKVAQRFANVKDALVGSLRALDKTVKTHDKAVLRALQNRTAPTEAKVIRRQYNAATGVWSPKE